MANVKIRQEFFPIDVEISREDLETIGFDTKDVEDETMEKLAKKMSDDYMEQLYWISMKTIASECLKIKRK